ncbi:MAG: 3-dehydroquinate synthase [Oscillospiraceae bacterium]|nr:3-dehydroquinate synthase [Oscillospiraceae bacterium]
MTNVRINTEKPYDVMIGSGLLERCGELVSAVHTPCSAVLVSDSTVAPLYAEKARKSLEAAAFTVFTYIFPAGEESKNLSNFGEILSFMASCRLTRADIAVALGGGVTGDLTGFAAACYERGIPFVQMPTTLLSMVDASVGGKTAVDLPEGKNLAGAFHQPLLVVCDCDCLKTLPPERLSEGAAEMVKHALIADPSLLKPLAGGNILEHAELLVKRNVEIKRSFVVGDERDSGRRQLLNFGHTVGHAVEKLSGYTVSHGQAVAIGMVAALRGAGGADLEKIAALLEKLGLPTRCPYGAQEVYIAALGDKKRSGEYINYVVLESPGSAKTVRMSKPEFRAFLEKAVPEGV